ncbi:PqqD family peptide modification chaperone [Nocardiopsis mangrovi]|uniref:PqqD family peptide modification chaperone n=1 Tax=Nocardiopsis mangrovi TaxID=1179818 RepID=A0ABV9DXT2_9ACTN
MTGLAPHITLTSTDDGTMVLNERTGRMFHLNDSGREALLAALAGGTSAAAERLRHRYGIDDARARHDAEAALAVLAAHGLIMEDGNR